MNFSAPGLIRNISQYLFFGNIFISTCAFCLFWATCILIARPLPLAPGLFVFFATWLLYNFDSRLPYKRQQQVRFSRRRAWAKQHKAHLLSFMVVAGGAALYLFFQTFFQIGAILLLAHLALLSLLYSVPVVPVQGTFWPLRHIPLLKIFLIAYVWSCVTVWLPLLAFTLPLFTTAAWLLFVQRFLFLLAITIIFDIRDLERDKATGTITLPGSLGVPRAKFLAWFSLGLFVLFAVFTLENHYSLALAVSAVATAWVVGRAHAQRSEYFYAVGGDGMMLLQLLLLLLV